VVRFLSVHLRGYRALIGVGVILTLFEVAADIAMAFPLKFVLDKVINHHDPSFPLAGSILGLFNGAGSGQGLQAGEHHTQLAVILFAVTLIVVLGLITALLTYMQLFIAAFVGQNLAFRLRVGLFDHLQRLSLEWHGRHRIGDLVQRLTSQIADIEKLVTDGLVDLLAGILTLTAVLVIMLAFSWQFTLLTMVVVPGLVVVVLGYTKSIKAANKRAQKTTADVGDIATEDMAAITEIKAFTVETRESLHFRAFARKLFEAKFTAGTLQAEFTPLVLILTTISTAAVVGIGSYVATGHTFSLLGLTIPAGSLTFGTLILFLTYLKELYQPMRDLSKLANLASSASSAAERVQGALDAEPEVADSHRPYRGPTRLQGDVRYAGVAFGYVEDQPVLRTIDLEIPAGRKVALVGLSGSGKTTLVKLIPRFYDVWDGSIAVDGVDVRDYPLALLRANVSLVLQESLLFEGTVRDNLVIGRPDATDREIVQAAKNAHIHDQILQQTGGYGAPVREAGKNFSGGQRQRLAIARAIVRDSPILILDEPTASLDVEAEGEVMHAIAKLIVGRTVLMISHRLNALGHADEIIVLQEGEIAEHGSYRQLKRLGGVFAQMLEEQNRYSADELAEPTPLPALRHPRPPAAATDDGFAAARSRSRWVALEEPVEDGERGGDAASASTLITDLRPSRRSVRGEQR
jgi:ABC-type multidrug transport system fused ATPase/permease subunit